jgi:hypothetical protein
MDDERARDTIRQPVADRCSLTQPELDARLEEIERLTRWALKERRDDPGGTVLTFDLAAGAEVRDLVQRERDCCSHLELAVEESEAAIRLTIRSRSGEQGRQPAGSPLLGRNRP